MVKGGKRKGAGNRVGSIRPNFNAYWTPKEIDDYMTWLKANYQNNTDLVKYVGDHLFGKAAQPLTGEGGGPIQIGEVIVKIQK